MVILPGELPGDGRTSLTRWERDRAYAATACCSFGGEADTICPALNLELVLAAEDATRAGIVLTGAQDFFSGGIDTREVPGYDRTKRAAMLQAINAIVHTLCGFGKPTAAAVSGHALGGAFVLALGAHVDGPDADAFAGIIDRHADPAQLLSLAAGEVRRLAMMPAYGRVKAQLRSAVLERLRLIVDQARDPLFEHWT